MSRRDASRWYRSRFLMRLMRLKLPGQNWRIVCSTLQPPLDLDLQMRCPSHRGRGTVSRMFFAIRGFCLGSGVLHDLDVMLSHALQATMHYFPPQLFGVPPELALQSWRTLGVAQRAECTAPRAACAHARGRPPDWDPEGGASSRRHGGGSRAAGCSEPPRRRSSHCAALRVPPPQRACRA